MNDLVRLYIIIKVSLKQSRLTAVKSSVMFIFFCVYSIVFCLKMDHILFNDWTWYINCIGFFEYCMDNSCIHYKDLLQHLLLQALALFSLSLHKFHCDAVQVCLFISLQCVWVQACMHMDVHSGMWVHIQGQCTPCNEGDTSVKIMTFQTKYLSTQDWLENSTLINITGYLPFHYLVLLSTFAQNHKIKHILLTAAVIEELLMYIKKNIY